MKFYVVMARSCASLLQRTGVAERSSASRHLLDIRTYFCYAKNVMAILMPKKVKHRKWQKGRLRGKAWRGSSLSFGSFGLKSLGTVRLTARQIEAARRAMTRFVKREGKIWIRVFPDKPITRKPAETGMGKGKGSVDHFVAQVKPGLILFEMAGVPEKIAQEAMRRAAHKLPIKTKFVKR